MDYASINITTGLINTTNKIRMAVYKNSDPLAIVASLDDTNNPHVSRTWAFANLQRVLHNYRLYELDSSNNIINTLIGPIDFLPSNQSFEWYPPKVIQAGVTPIPGNETQLWPINTNMVTVPGWAGRELESFVYPGAVGELKRDPTNEIDLSWDAGTTILKLLIDGLNFQQGEYYIAHFKPKIIQSSGATGQSAGSTVQNKEVIANTTLDIIDAGKNIIINPSGVYLEITLFDFTTIPENVITTFEFSSSWNSTDGHVPKCAVIKTKTGQTIAWLETLTNLFICPNESIGIYKRALSSTSFELRVSKPFGNFLTAGEFVWQDMDTKKVVNMIEATGAACNYQQYARVFNRRVLAGGDAIPYSSWGLSTANKMKFSLKDTAGNNFRIPDLNSIPVYMRPHGPLNNPGDFIAQQMLQHQHVSSSNVSTNKSVGPWGYYQTTVSHVGKFTGEGTYYPDMTSRAMVLQSGIWVNADGPENNPNSRASRWYIKI